MNPSWPSRTPVGFNSPLAQSARTAQWGFTLFETILVIGMLAAVAAVLLTMQSKLWANQSVGRDQSVGQALISACAERLLAVRRNVGYANVTNGPTTQLFLCNGMGTTGGFPADPVVSLKDASGATVTSCSSATCTATISITNSAGTVVIRPLTLQLSNY